MKLIKKYSNPNTPILPKLNTMLLQIEQNMKRIADLKKLIVTDGINTYVPYGVYYPDIYNNYQNVNEQGIPENPLLITNNVDLGNGEQGVLSREAVPIGNINDVYVVLDANGKVKGTTTIPDISKYTVVWKDNEIGPVRLHESLEKVPNGDTFVYLNTKTDLNGNVSELEPLPERVDPADNALNYAMAGIPAVGRYLLTRSTLPVLEEIVLTPEQLKYIWGNAAKQFITSTIGGEMLNAASLFGGYDNFGHLLYSATGGKDWNNESIWTKLLYNFPNPGYWIQPTTATVGTAEKVAEEALSKVRLPENRVTYGVKSLFNHGFYPVAIKDGELTTIYAANPKTLFRDMRGIQYAPSITLAPFEKGAGHGLPVQYIESGYPGKGYGRGLYAAAINEAQNQGYAGIEVGKDLVSAPISNNTYKYFDKILTGNNGYWRNDNIVEHRLGYVPDAITANNYDEFYKLIKENPDLNVRLYNAPEYLLTGYNGPSIADKAASAVSDYSKGMFNIDLGQAYREAQMAKTLAGTYAKNVGLKLDNGWNRFVQDKVGKYIFMPRSGTYTRGVGMGEEGVNDILTTGIVRGNPRGTETTAQYFSRLWNKNTGHFRDIMEGTGIPGIESKYQSRILTREEFDAIKKESEKYIEYTNPFGLRRRQPLEQYNSYEDYIADIEETIKQVNEMPERVKSGEVTTDSTLKGYKTEDGVTLPVYEPTRKRFGSNSDYLLDGTVLSYWYPDGRNPITEGHRYALSKYGVRVNNPEEYVPFFHANHLHPSFLMSPKLNDPNVELLGEGPFGLTVTLDKETLQPLWKRDFYNWIKRNK